LDESILMFYFWCYICLNYIFTTQSRNDPNIIGSETGSNVIVSGNYYTLIFNYYSVIGYLFLKVLLSYDILWLSILSNRKNLFIFLNKYYMEIDYSE